GLWGPAAREILQPLTEADLSNDAFHYMRGQEIAVGPVPCLALRVTYVGELGWELYCPMEFGLRLFDAIWEAGKEHGLVAGGYKAIDSLRLEKGYRVWGADITPDENPYEAGLDFAVKLDKGDFIGREALDLASREEPERRLACLVLSDPRSAPSRCGWTERPWAGSRAAGTGTASSARSHTHTCRAQRCARARRSRSRSSGTGSRARSPRSPSGTRVASESAPRAFSRAQFQRRRRGRPRRCSP